MSPERWQRIEQIFYDALERPADERVQFVAEACADDGSLIPEIAALLAANDQASGFLTKPAMQWQAQDMAAENSTANLAVQIGQHLSHYKILARIGAGGMGEVYLARDSSLERRVALKLLPVQFTQDVERLQRFVREAKAASALNHPNIITIYEIGEVKTAAGKMHFIATEFIEGVTLRAWEPDDESLRLNQTLAFGIQIASALDAAHQSGIVHRDIKPENLMVRPDGLIKVLDFGLAKLTATNNSAETLIDTNAQTTPAEMQTLPGMILGTLRYMSPEQARGRALDSRTDIFSLGVVLYELLTSKPLFAGDTSADIIAAIIHKEPEPLHSSLPDVPAELERILRKALAKDSRDRYQTARDLQLDLQALKQESELNARMARSGQSFSVSSGAVAVEPLGAASNRSRHLWWLIPTLVLLLGSLWWKTSRHSGVVEIPPLSDLKNVAIVRWPSSPGEGTVQGKFSPDGKWVAFTSTQGGRKNVWIKQATAQGDAQPSSLDGFLNLNPIWSSNGEEIVFFSSRGGSFGVWRKPPFGGTPTLIKTMMLEKLCAWSKNGATIYYEVGNNLYELQIDSGQTKQLTHFQSGKTNAEGFSLSADERLIAYHSRNAQGETAFFVMPLKGGTPKQIASIAAEARGTVWHPDSQRIFFNARVNGTYQCFAADLDGHQPAQITFGDRDSFITDVSIDGSKLLLGSAVEESNVWAVDAVNATESVVASDIDFEYWPSVSPDGKTVAYQTLKNFSQGHNENSLVVLKTLASADAPRVLVKEGYLARWSPDGQQLAYMRQAEGKQYLSSMSAVGGGEQWLATGKLQGLTNSVLPYQSNFVTYYDWSPDSLHLSYSAEVNGKSNLWIVAADGSGNASLTNHTDSNLLIQNPIYSNDGKQLAYLSRTRETDADGKFDYGVWVAEVASKVSKTLFQVKNEVRLLGWAAGGQALILAVSKKKTGPIEAEVELLSVDAKTGTPRSLAILPRVYFFNLYLSPDKRMIAFTAHQADKDDIWLIPVSGGYARKLTTNSDPDVYFSSLAWAPNNRTIYFGKQTRHGLFAMLTGFK